MINSLESLWRFIAPELKCDVKCNGLQQNLCYTSVLAHVQSSSLASIFSSETISSTRFLSGFLIVNSELSSIAENEKILFLNVLIDLKLVP